MEQTMPSEEFFEVRVLIYDRSNRFERLIDHLEKVEPIMGSTARLKLAVQVVTETQQLVRYVRELVAGAKPGRIILLSEGLVIRNEHDAWEATSFARQVRHLFICNPAHLCGLIALLNDQPHRITDIDAVLRIDDLTPESVKRKLLQVATRLWLKSPVGALSSMESRDAIRVHRVRSASEMRECFRLRHRVYDALGYLEEPISRSVSGIDIDSFDTKAIHFAAVDHRSHEFVGTARLVTTVPQRIGQTIIGDPWRVIQNHAEWVKDIGRQALLKE